MFKNKALVEYYILILKKIKIKIKEWYFIHQDIAKTVGNMLANKSIKRALNRRRDFVGAYNLTRSPDDLKDVPKSSYHQHYSDIHPKVVLKLKIIM